MSWRCCLFSFLVELTVYLLNWVTVLLLGVWNTSPQIFSRNLPNSSHEYADDNKRLARIWQGSNKQPIAFTSIVVHAWDLDRSKITDIGVSIWHPESFAKFEINSFHWQIRENITYQNQHILSNPDIFTFGSTELITSTQIAAKLNDVFNSPMIGVRKITIIGHDVRATMGLLEDYWKPPDSTTYLDTQKIWQLQHQQSDQIELEKALETTSGVRFNGHLLHNAGNDARYILLLLRAQVRTTGLSED